MSPTKPKTKFKSTARDATASKTERLRKAALAELKAKRETIEAADSAPNAEVVPADADLLEHHQPSDEERHDDRRPAEPTAAKRRKARAEPPPKPAKVKKVSGLDAAAIVLAGAREPMSAKEIVAEVFSRKLWSSKGETPEATLYAALIREIAAKGATARFVKAERGRFTLAKMN